MDGLAVKTVCLLGLLTCLTVRQQAVWRSEESLWRAAVLVNATSPRPPFNLAHALRVQGRPIESTAWLLEAWHRAEGHPARDWWRQRIREQVFGLEMAGYPVCDSAPRLPLCS